MPTLAQLVECWTDDQKVVSLNPSRRVEREFCSPGLIFFADSYLVSILTRATAFTFKRLQSFCQKCRWQVTPKHTYTLDPNGIGVGGLCCPGIVLELIRETSSHTTHQGMTDNSHLSLLSHCGLTLT